MSTVTASTRTRIIAAASAVAIALGIGVTSAGAAQAADTGSISGTITLPADAPSEWMNGIVVNAMSGDVGYGAQPDAEGNYVLENLPPGEYMVRAWAEPYQLDGSDTWNDAPPLLMTYHDGAWLEEESTPVPVGSDAVEDIDITLAYGRSISGTVTLDEGADPSLLSSPIEVRASRKDNRDAPTETAIVDPKTGEYTISTLIPTEYMIEFAGIHGDDGMPTNVVAEYYDDAWSRGRGTPVDVTSEDATGIDASLAEGHSISGTVTLADGAPGEWLRGVKVFALDGLGGPLQETMVDIDTGAYTLNQLSPDWYVVHFVPEWYESPTTGRSVKAGFTAEYYDNAGTLDDAPVIDVETGSVTGIDAVLSAYGPDGRFVDVSSDPTSADYTQFHRQIEWLADRGISTGFHVGDGQHEFRAKASISREAMAAFMYRHAGSPQVTLPARSPFTDVKPGSQFYKEIVWLSQEGISTGWRKSGSKAEFRPKEPIARDAMAAFLYRYADRPSFTPPSRSPFTDTSATGTQFYKEITWLASTGVSTGWTKGGGKAEYRPYTDITREAMAAFLYRYDRL